MDYEVFDFALLGIRDDVFYGNLDSHSSDSTHHWISDKLCLGRC